MPSFALRVRRLYPACDKARSWRSGFEPRGLNLSRYQVVLSTPFRRLPGRLPGPRPCPASTGFLAFPAANDRHVAILFWPRWPCPAATAPCPGDKHLPHFLAAVWSGHETVLRPWATAPSRRRPVRVPDAAPGCRGEVAKPPETLFRPGAFAAAHSSFPQVPDGRAPNQDTPPAACQWTASKAVRWRDRDNKANLDR